MKIFSLICVALALTACACNCKDQPMPSVAHQVAPVSTGTCQTVMIEGMTCEACAVTISENFKKQAGVDAVTVDVTKGVAQIHLAKDKTLPAATIKKVVTGSGYTFKSVANGC